MGWDLSASSFTWEAWEKGGEFLADWGTNRWFAIHSPKSYFPRMCTGPSGDFWGHFAWPGHWPIQYSWINAPTSRAHSWALSACSDTPASIRMSEVVPVCRLFTCSQGSSCKWSRVNPHEITRISNPSEYSWWWYWRSNTSRGWRGLSLHFHSSLLSE